MLRKGPVGEEERVVFLLSPLDEGGVVIPLRSNEETRSEMHSAGAMLSPHHCLLLAPMPPLPASSPPARHHSFDSLKALDFERNSRPPQRCEQSAHTKTHTAEINFLGPWDALPDAVWAGAPEILGNNLFLKNQPENN